MISICCEGFPLRTRQDNPDLTVKECPNCGSIIKQRNRQPEGKYQVIFFFEIEKGIATDEITKLLESWYNYVLMYAPPIDKRFKINRFKVKKSTHR